MTEMRPHARFNRAINCVRNTQMCSHRDGRPPNQHTWKPEHRDRATRYICMETHILKNLTLAEVCRKMSAICQRSADATKQGAERVRLQANADNFRDEANNLAMAASEQFVRLAPDGNVMRTARQCLVKAAEMQRAADACRDEAMQTAYEEMAAHWRHVALQAQWQDTIPAEAQERQSIAT